MTPEECIAHIQTSGLFNDAEIKQWTGRVQKKGINEQLSAELISDIQRRISTLAGIMGMNNETSDTYKQLMLDFYAELKGIAKEYKSGEKQIEKEGGDILRKEDQLEAVKHIAESKAAISHIAEQKEKSS